MNTHDEVKGSHVACAVRLGALLVFIATLSAASKVWAGVIWWTIASLTFQHGVMSLIDVLLRATGRLARQGSSGDSINLQSIVVLLITLANAAALWIILRNNGGVLWLARRIRRFES